jgi:hypothetical protein
MQEIVRNPDGTFADGHSGNPDGAKARKGWQPYGQRLQKYMDMPGEEIGALINDPERLHKLSGTDIACVRHSAEIIGGKAWMEALERALNRIEGTPTQTIIHGKIGGIAEIPSEFTDDDAALQHYENVVRSIPGS